MVKHEEGGRDGNRKQERVREVQRWMSWFIGVAGEAWGRPTPVLSVWCFRVRSTGSETGLLTGKCVALIWIPCVCVSLSLSLSLFSSRQSGSAPPAVVYLPNSLSTLPSFYWSSLCRLSRWPSLRSALEFCFYIAASRGMWSLFWTALQTDGGFHAAFMRLSETFP